MAQSPFAPSLLSRGAAPAEARASGVHDEFQPYIGAISGYDSGLLTSDLERSGGPFQEIDGGLEARHASKRASFLLDYNFAARHYAANSRLDFSDHALNLDSRFFLSRRLTVVLRDAAVSSSFGNGLQQPQPLATLSPGFFVDGGPEVFHTRTFANTALADVVFSPSARTSFSAGGDGFVVERQSQALLDAVGWRARADFAHRYSRHKTISLSYSFTHFDHARSFGGADYAVYAVGHSLRLGKISELDLLAGAGLLRSSGVRAVTLDPEIARLLGISRGAEIFRLHTWAPHLAAAWLQDVGSAELRVELARLVSDGGGLTGLARQNLGTVTLAPARARHWRPSAIVEVRTFRSLDTLLYNSTSALAGASLTRRIGPRTEALLRYQYAFYNFQTGLLRDFGRHQIAVGVMYYFHDRPDR